MIQIRRSSKPKKYFVSSWFITNTDDYQPENDDPNQVCKILELEEIQQKDLTLNQIKKRLEKVFQEAGKYNFGNSKMFWIEFFVEPDLLNEPIDCWKASNSSTPLGFQYNVLTRLAKRISNYTHRPRWLTKWETIKQQNLSNGNITFASQYNNIKQLYVDIAQDRACILIIDQCYQKQEYTKIIPMIEDTGIPIMVWIRENTEILNHQIVIKELVKDTILDLPNKIRQKRSDAFGCSDEDLEKKHIGNHLTLVWENPYLYPIELKYSSPKSI